jgi:hypothetical protein
MLTRLLRQRRRVLFLAVCFGLAWFVLEGAGPFVGAAALTGAGIAGLALWIAPRQRAVLDSIGVAVAGLALLQVPLAALPLLLPLGAAVAHGVLYGTWWDKTGLRVGLRSRARARLAAPPHRVWHAIVPGEGHPDDDLSGTLVDFDTDPEDDLTLYLRHILPNGTVEETTVTFLDRIAPKQCAYLLERPSGRGSDETEVRLHLEPAGPDGTMIRLAHSQSRLQPGLALRRWFDDTAGDTLDSLRAHLGGKPDWSIKPLGRDLRRAARHDPVAPGLAGPAAKAGALAGAADGQTGGISPSARNR